MGIDGRANICGVVQAGGYVDGLPAEVTFAPLGAAPMGDAGMMGLPRQDSSAGVPMGMAAQPALGMPAQPDVKAENFDDMMHILFSVRGSPFSMYLCISPSSLPPSPTLSLLFRFNSFLHACCSKVLHERLAGGRPGGGGRYVCEVADWRFRLRGQNE